MKYIIAWTFVYRVALRGMTWTISRTTQEAICVRLCVCVFSDSLAVFDVVMESNVCFNITVT